LSVHAAPDPEDLRLFEFEFGVGINMPGAWAGVEKVRPGTNFILEWRINRPRFFDFGLQFKGGNFQHRTPGVFTINSQIIRPTLFVDYNHRPDRETAFFAGVGLGGSFVQNQTVVYLDSHSSLLMDDSSRAFAVTPRVGITILNGLRVTAEYVITEPDYSCFNLNVGLLVGGSYKKPLRQKPGRRTYW
jgi:hypothetical protein